MCRLSYLAPMHRLHPHHRAVSCVHALPTDTWHVVNDQDAVVRSGKLSSLLIRLMERPGTKVLVDRRGDMLCAPSAIEAYLNLVPWGE